jgi:fermentation-respiration switch protein FrsA (DUF1100 family)
MMEPPMPPSRTRRLATRVGAVVLSLVILTYASAAAYLKINETDLVFPREVAPGRLPAPADSLRLPYREIGIATEDGVTLGAWIIPAAPRDSSGIWILLCHGQTGHVGTTTRPEYYAYLRHLGVNILAFDWRGFGASTGTPTEAGLYRDATAAYRYLRDVQRVAPERIVIFGHSLGTAPAIELATRVEAAALIIEGGPSSVRRRGQELYPWLPIALLSSAEFNSLGRIPSVKMPVLAMHATADRKIPIAHGRALFDAAKARKRFVDLRGDHHDAFLADSATYFEAYRAFLAEIVGGPGGTTRATGTSRD